MNYVYNSMVNLQETEMDSSRARLLDQLWRRSLALYIMFFIVLHLPMGLFTFLTLVMIFVLGNASSAGWKTPISVKFTTNSYPDIVPNEENSEED